MGEHRTLQHTQGSEVKQPALSELSDPQVRSPAELLPVCVLRWAFRWELFVYTLLQPSKSHLWIRRFLESGDSDLLWRLVLSILNGEIELEKEKVDLNGEQTQHPVWFPCHETWGSQSAASYRLKAPGPRYGCHFLGHVSLLNLEGGQLDLFLMKHSSGEENMLKITTEWKKRKSKWKQWWMSRPPSSKEIIRWW